MKKHTLLVVEDEVAIRDMLHFALSSTYRILDADSAESAIRILLSYKPDLILVDWMLPSKSGVDLIKWIRKQTIICNIPIIMLTAKAEEENKIAGLLTGADDYITKPFSIVELQARIKTVMRRGPIRTIENIVNIDNISLSTERCEIVIENSPLLLSPMEYKLLAFFILHPNKSFSRDHLISQIWGINTYIDHRTVDVLIRRLREKLKPFNHHKRIKTIRGIGYLFEDECNEK